MEVMCNDCWSAWVCSERKCFKITKEAAWSSEYNKYQVDVMSLEVHDTVPLIHLIFLVHLRWTNILFCR
jgi:hypothetical protein